MKLQNSQLTRLKEMISLEEKRVALQGELESIQQQLATLQQSVIGGAPAASIAPTAAAPVPSPKSAPKTRGKRGSLKETIFAALHAAGSAGVRVKELAAALGTKPVNVHSWFHSTSKRNPSIIKISGGHYRILGKAAEASPASAPKPAAKPAAKAKASNGAAPGTASGTRRGALSEQILSSLSSAGKEGITLKDLADEVGSKYKNIAIWFSTTGKKNSAIRKMAPARYRLAA